MTDQPWTVMKLLEWTREYLGRAGVDSPRLCAEVLLAASLGCGRMELYARFDQLPGEAELGRFRDSVRRAGAGEPVAYITGQKEFYSIGFRVGPGVLIPRPETELLVSKVVDYLRAADGQTTVWDVCTGSGCVAVAVACNAKNATLLATDISPEALATAAENVACQDLANRVTVARAELLSVPSEWTGPGEFDVITANPPYVGDDDEVGFSVDYEPALALRAGADGLDIIRPLVAQAPAWLKPGGLLAMEFGHGQADAIREIILATGQFDEPAILQDLQGIDRVALAKKRENCPLSPLPA